MKSDICRLKIYSLAFFFFNDTATTEIYTLSLHDALPIFTFTIEADRFLHRMVRFLVGAMVDVALDRRPASDLPRLLSATDNRAASPPAPPQGLYLVAVRYPPDLYAEA